MSSKSFECLLLIFVFTTAQGEQLLSPCPEVFQFDSQEEGTWNATLSLNAPHILKGIYIKLYFDQDVDELSVRDDSSEIINLDDPANRGFLIKNKDAILRGDRFETRKIVISVQYSGIAPNIQELRINGYTLCPSPNTNRTDFYPSDPQAALSNYLESIACETGLYSSKDCGKSDSDNRFPWQVALFTTDGKKSNYTCEAILISSKYLVTPAHCVSYLGTKMPLLPEKLAVYFDIDNIGDIEKKQPFSISKIILYPGYQPRNLLNDIALLQLKNIAEIKIIPVCLPSQASDHENETLYGFKLENNKIETIDSSKLNKVKPDEKCFRTAALNAFVGDNTYCASYTDEKAALIGDSGSGSYVQIEDRYQLKGLLTIGGALSKDKSRNILLTDVYGYDKWIRKSLSE